MERSINFCTLTADISSEFEKTNSKLKKQYLLENIKKYHEITAHIIGKKGTFGTGYPFYALGPHLKGDLPIIDEQLRYNNELISAAAGCKYSNWTCAHCLSENGTKMPDLKTICKTCHKMDDSLKPRKLINRLPDIDLWIVCNKDQVEETKRLLTQLFKEHNMIPSDIDPVHTIEEVGEIVNDIKRGIMPNKWLPLDTHIIDYETFIKLIEQLPQVLLEAKKTGKIPYLPIHPFSLRKKWQQDDEPYNFVQDFLLSLTDFNFEPTLKAALEETRKILAKTYTIDELYEIMLSSGPESVVRRQKTKQLQLCFKERIQSWKK